MSRRLVVCLSVFLLVWCTSEISTRAQSSSSSLDRKERSLRKRRVGYLKQNPTSKKDGVPFILRDVWDHRTYFVSPAKGLSLDAYLDRYVAVHGTAASTEPHDGQPDVHRFRVEKVVALDSRGGLAEKTETDEPSEDAFVSAVRQVNHQTTAPLPSPAASLPSETLAPDLQVEPIPFDNTVEIPTPDLGFAEPAATGLPSESCAGCGLTHWSLPAGLATGGGGCCGPPESIWLRAEYLLWWTDGMRLPPLVTTSPSGTSRTQAGVLGEPGTQQLTPAVVNNDARSGLRLRGGVWLGAGNRLGIGGDIYWLSDQVWSFQAGSDGSTILARPFFDSLNGQETAELVSFPGVISGTVASEVRTEFGSAGIHLRVNLCCADWTANACGHDSARLDGLFGYRFARLDDSLIVTENLTSLDSASPGSFEILDSFRTENEFHGGELGVQYQRQRGRWMVEVLSKLALGNMRQVVAIDGRTRIRSGDVDMTFPSGILAQRTNIGRYKRNTFAVVPEVGVTLGYQLTPRLRLTLGYTLVYLSNVVRAGDQIDRDLNPNLFPPEADPFSGPLRPEFAFRETDFWAQGFSVGGDLRW